MNDFPGASSRIEVAAKMVDGHCGASVGYGEESGLMLIVRQEGVDAMQQDEGGWMDIPQERVSNRLTKPLSYRSAIRKDYTSEAASADFDGYHLRCGKGEILMGLSEGTFQFLDCLLLLERKMSDRAQKVDIRVEDYMKARGLKDRKTAKDQMKRAAKALYNVSIRVDPPSPSSGKKKGKPSGTVTSDEFRILERKTEFNGDGHMTVCFSSTFFALLSSATPMRYNGLLLGINTGKLPGAYSVGRKLLEQRNMARRDKDSAACHGDSVCLRVETLLNVMGYGESAILTHPSLARNYGTRIRGRLERNLNALRGMGTWSYTLRKGCPLDKPIGEYSLEELRTMVMVHFAFIGRPHVSLPCAERAD